jgi:hypothetical protein
LGGLQKIEKGEELSDIEKREKCGYPRFHSPIDVAALAMERMANTEEDLDREGRGVRKPPTIRLEEIERPHRKQNHLKQKWMYGKERFLSSSEPVEQYCESLWTNH